MKWLEHASTTSSRGYKYEMAYLVRNAQQDPVSHSSPFHTIAVLASDASLYSLSLCLSFFLSLTVPLSFYMSLHMSLLSSPIPSIYLPFFFSLSLSLSPSSLCPSYTPPESALGCCKKFERYFSILWPPCDLYEMAGPKE